MMAYIDFALGFLTGWAVLWILASKFLHRWGHTRRDGIFLRGRLVCRHCFDEAESMSKDQWREEALDKLRKLL